MNFKNSTYRIEYLDVISGQLYNIYILEKYRLEWSEKKLFLIIELKEALVYLGDIDYKKKI